MIMDDDSSYHVCMHSCTSDQLDANQYQDDDAHYFTEHTEHHWPIVTTVPAIDDCENSDIMDMDALFSEERPEPCPATEACSASAPQPLEILGASESERLLSDSFFRWDGGALDGHSRGHAGSDPTSRSGEPAAEHGGGAAEAHRMSTLFDFPCWAMTEGELEVLLRFHQDQAKAARPDAGRGGASTRPAAASAAADPPTKPPPPPPSWPLPPCTCMGTATLLSWTVLPAPPRPAAAHVVTATHPRLGKGRPRLSPHPSAGAAAEGAAAGVCKVRLPQVVPPAGCVRRR